MSYEDQTNSQKGLLIVCEQPNLGDSLSYFIHRDLPDFDIKVCTSYADAESYLHTTAMNWLLAWEGTATGEWGIVDERVVQDPEGVQLAKKWLDASASHRAILLTQSYWDKLPWTFCNRLSAIPLNKLSLNGSHVIMDIINAGENGFTLVLPTIVKLHFQKDRWGRCYLTRKESTDGPLKDLVEAELQHCPEKQFVGPFKQLANSFRDASLEDDAGRSREKLISTSKRIGQVLGQDGLLRSLFVAMQKSLQLWGDARICPSGPFPVHLHLTCNPEMLAVPLDLALHEGDGMSHTNTIFPVTWRLRTAQRSRPRSDLEREYNLTNNSELRAAYSGDMQSSIGNDIYEALPNAHNEIKAILGCSENECDGRHHANDLSKLKNLLISPANRLPYNVHVAGHGTNGNLGDNAGLVLDGGIRVNAQALIPNEGETGPGFAYFNCCRLATQDTTNRNTSSYFGGFAEGVVITGFCNEVICNRWSVSDLLCSEIAREFYRVKQRTVFGRASALLRARLRIAEKVKTMEEHYQLDLTGLSPVHIWALPDGECP